MVFICESAQIYICWYQFIRPSVCLSVLDQVTMVGPSRNCYGKMHINKVTPGHFSGLTDSAPNWYREFTRPFWPFFVIFANSPYSFDREVL